MISTRIASVEGAHAAIARRRIELRLVAGKDPDVLENELADLAKECKVEMPVRRRRDYVRRLDVELVGGAGELAGLVQAVTARPGVRIMRDEVLPLSGTQDPLYPDPAVLRRVVAPTVRAEPPAQGGAAGQRVVVAIVDSGVMTAHPDLAPHLSRGPDGRVRGFHLRPDPDDGEDGDVEDGDGHGTLLAGTVLAGANRSSEVCLLPVKFIDGRTRPESGRAAKAIRWAVDNGADIIDLSWEVGIANPELRAAIEYAGAKGVLVVVAAGNSGADNDRRPAFPACYGHDECQAVPKDKGLSNVITVMASDRFDDKPGFSNYGRRSVHIAAPGAGVISTHQTLRGGLSPRDPGLYQRYDGSSASAACVAGAAALLKAKNRKLSPRDIKDLLIKTSDSRPDLRCQKGRLNVSQALDAV